MENPSNKYLASYQQFIQEVVEHKVVYAIKNNEGYATAFSNDYVDDEEHAVEVFCFWSNNVSATKLLADEWEGFEIDVITLEDFLEKWCVGMNNEGLLIGANFNEQLDGYEADPLDVILDIVAALKSKNENLPLTKYKDSNELAEKVNELLA